MLVLDDCTGLGSEDMHLQDRCQDQCLLSLYQWKRDTSHNPAYLAMGGKSYSEDVVGRPRLLGQCRITNDFMFNTI